MILKDLLKPNVPQLIMARTFLHDGEDLLFGYCHWDGNKLISDDGDGYYLDDVVVKYEYWENYLIYWFESKWT